MTFIHVNNPDLDTFSVTTSTVIQICRALYMDYPQVGRGRGMGNPPGVGVGVLWGLGRGCFFDTLAVPLTPPPVPQVPLSTP